MDVPYYLKIGRASDLKNKKERIIYRFLEILPGGLSWLTLFLAVLFSWLKPVWTAYFIICFVIYWLFRTIYFSFHLQTCYKEMQKNEKVDWLEKLKKIPKSKNIYHLVILPMYKEPLEIVRETFNCLLKSDWPKEKMVVVLTCEEKEGNKEVAENIKKGKSVLLSVDVKGAMKVKRSSYGSRSVFIFILPPSM